MLGNLTIVDFSKANFSRTKPAKYGGTIAVATAFEPRLLNIKPGRGPRCTWMALKDLTMSVEQAVLGALALDLVQNSGVNTSRSMNSSSMQIYQECASALENRKKRSKLLNMEESHLDRENATGVPPQSGCLGSKSIVDGIALSTDAWLEELDPVRSTTTFKDGSANLTKNVVPWIAPILFYFYRLVDIALSPIRYLL